MPPVSMPPPQKALCPDHWRQVHSLSSGTYAEHCWTMRPDGLAAHVPVPGPGCDNCRRIGAGAH